VKGLNVGGMGDRMKQLMRMAHDNLTDRVLVDWVSNVMTAVHVGLGVAIIVGGQVRFSPPSYDPLVEMANGAVWIWGAWILVSAGMMIIPFKWIQVVGLWLGMCWMIMWSVLFAVAMFRFPEASSTATVAYAGFAMIDAALLTAKVLERGRR
jgi:hypothetical protein